MTKQNGEQSHTSQPIVYQIRIESHLDDQWADWFSGLNITLEENGDTLLTGPVADQAALFGLLKKVRDLGLPLVSVNCVDPCPERSRRAGKSDLVSTSLEGEMNMVANGKFIDKIGRETTLRQRLWAAAELLVFAALVVGANVFDVVPISETPWLLVLGWLSLRWRGLTWQNLGLRRPESWITTLMIAFVSAVALQLLSEFVIEPMTGRPDLSSFQSVVGNLPAALGLLALVWTLAAFGEEMAYRGYVLERMAALGHHSSVAYTSAVVVVSLLFGLGHFYQGLAGVIGSSISGLLFGMLYLKGKRNLWLPILAHGLSDTIGLALIYLGLAPGL